MIQNKKTNGIFICLLLVLFIAGCQKKDRPALGTYATDDAVLPDGPLRFFVPFGGDNSSARFNVPDMISTNPAQTEPLELVEGVNGKAVQGKDGSAIRYLNTNDFKNATSFTVAFWMKQTANANTELYFSLKDDTYGWSHSAIFLLVEHGTPTETTFKLGLMDQWMEFPDGNKFPRPLLDGNWHHIAMAYDETTSKVTYYFDGAVVPAPASATDVKNGSDPRGPLNFTASSNLVLGGWNKHGALPGPTDDWIHSFTGAMDQFRLYNKALPASDVLALYTNRE